MSYRGCFSQRRARIGISSLSYLPVAIRCSACRFCAAEPCDASRRPVSRCFTGIRCTQRGLPPPQYCAGTGAFIVHKNMGAQAERSGLRRMALCAGRYGADRLSPRRCCRHARRRGAAFFAHPFLLAEILLVMSRFFAVNYVLVGHIGRWLISNIRQHSSSDP